MYVYTFHQMDMPHKARCIDKYGKFLVNLFRDGTIHSLYQIDSTFVEVTINQSDKQLINILAFDLNYLRSDKTDKYLELISINELNLKA